MNARQRLLLAAGLAALALLGARLATQPKGDAPLDVGPLHEQAELEQDSMEPLAPASLALEDEGPSRVEAAAPPDPSLATAAAAPTASPPPTVRLRTARWTGDLLGLPVGDVAVECQSDTLPDGMWMELGRTDEHGLLEVPLFEPGRYRFGVDGHSLPADLLPPGDFPARGDEPVPGLVLPTAELAAGERAEITLWLMEARSIRGRVVDASGAPAPGAFVRVDTLETRVRMKARSNGAPVGDDGAFVIEGLYPLEYQLSLAAQSWARNQGPTPAWMTERKPATPNFRGAPRLYIDLRKRSLTDVELCVTPGDFAISGRLVDAAGQPAASRRVHVESTHLANGAPDARHDLTAFENRSTAASCTSDADGRFQLERLDRRPLELVIHATEVHKLDGGSWFFGESTALFTFDPSSDPEDSFDVGDVVVPTVSLYRASGTVEIDASHPDAGGIVRGDLMLDLHYGRDENLSALRHNTQPQREFDPNTGEFQYVCITPRNLATLWLYPSGQGGRGKAIQLYPKAGVVESGLVLTYP